MRTILGFHIYIITRQNLDFGDIVAWARAWCGCNDLAVLVDDLEVVSAEEMRNGRKLRAVPLGVVIKLKQGNSQELHVLWDAEYLCAVLVPSEAPAKVRQYMRPSCYRGPEMGNILDFGSWMK